MSNVQFFVKDNFGFTIDFYLIEKNGNARAYITSKKGVLKRTEYIANGSQVEPEPLFSIPREYADLLADALEKYGIQPLDMGETKGKLERTDKHLEDMRKIAFLLLNEEPRVEMTQHIEGRV